jgi:hypothetical protein
MPTNVPRRMTIKDIMIVIFAECIGLMLSKNYCTSIVLIHLNMLRNGHLRTIIHYYVFIINLIIPSAICLTVALFCVHLLYPRPALLQLSKQPGFLACGAVVLVLLINSASVLILSVVLSVLFNVDAFLTVGWRIKYFPETMAPFFGVGVAVSWAVLAISRRWQTDSSWVDRLGRALGLFWLAMIPMIGWLFMTYIIFT